MHIHVLQHVPFEGPAYIGQWAQERGHTLSYTRFYEPWHLPHIDQFDWLLIMGGPMSVHDTCSYEWMAKEKDFIISVGYSHQISDGRPYKQTANNKPFAVHAVAHHSGYRAHTAIYPKKDSHQSPKIGS